MKRRWVLIWGAGLSALMLAAVAYAAPFDVTFEGCVSGSQEVGTGAGKNCSNIPNSTSGGVASGLDGPFDIALSPDGKFAYVASFNDDAVTTFRRDATTGVLTFVGCVSGDTDAGTAAGHNCVNVPNSVAGGADSGLDFVNAVAIAPNGNHVYAASQNDDSVVAFSRNAQTGVLTFSTCISGDTTAQIGAGKNCAAIPNSSVGGGASGLDSITSLSMGDDQRLYATVLFDHSVVVFDRNPDNGTLTFNSCVSGDTAAQTPGKNCAPIPNSAAGANDSGLDRPIAGALSPDAKQLFVATQDDDSLVAFDRTPSGALTFNNCVSGDTAAQTPGKNCAPIPNSVASGGQSGLNRLAAVVSSPDGRQVYAASQEDASIVVLTRNADTGVLAFGSCVSGATAAGIGSGKNCVNLPNSNAAGGGSGLSGPEGVSASPDGRQVYAAVAGDSALTTFDRNADTGALAFRGCVSGDLVAGIAAGRNCVNVPHSATFGSGSGLAGSFGAGAVKPAPSGAHIYLVSPSDDAVAVFDREPLAVPGPPGATDTVAPVVSRFSLSRKRFRVGKARTPLSAKRRRTPAGTRVRYRLSEAATTSFVVERRLAGRRRRVRGRVRCVKPTRTLVRRRAKRCARYKRVGTLRRKGRVGSNSFAFSGRIGRRKLAPGRYRMRATAVDAAGNRSRTRSVTFTIKAR